MKIFGQNISNVKSGYHSRTIMRTTFENLGAQTKKGYIYLHLLISTPGEPDSHIKVVAILDTLSDVSFIKPSICRALSGAQIKDEVVMLSTISASNQVSTFQTITLDVSVVNNDKTDNHENENENENEKTFIKHKFYVKDFSLKRADIILGNDLRNKLKIDLDLNIGLKK